VINDHVWQAEALEKCLRLDQSELLIMASVGAGKTWFAARLAQQLQRKPLVVTPFTSIFRGWQETLAEHGIQVTQGYDPHALRKGYRGFIVAYQSLPFSAQELRAVVSRGDWLVIFDEIHHLGRDRAWGEAAQTAFKGIPGLRILGLTGTAWRTDGLPIPFTQCDANGYVMCDHKYLYGDAVRDGIVRPIEFPAIDANAQIAGPDGYSKLRIQDATDDQLPEVIRSTIDGRSDWLIKALQLGEAKRRDHARILPSAAGILFASTQEQAHLFAQLMLTNLGIRPVVVLSDDPESDTKINEFRTSRDTWTVAVRKMGEGVNIPRLTVAVFATNVRTELFFNQASGRIVRRVYDPVTETYLDNGITACMIIPAAVPHVRYAKRIYDEVQRALQEREQDTIAEPRGPGEPPILKPVLPATDAELLNVIHDGHDHDPALLELSQAITDQVGAGNKYQIHDLLASHRVQVSQPQPVPAAVLQDEEIRLRHEVEQLSRQRDNQLGLNFGDTNLGLRQAGFPPRKQANLDQLKAMRAYLMRGG
jgi:superfamily II DNA or RNA helicase